ncbi:MAG: protein arginine kinase [Planctomycetia bacterium]
MKLNDLATKPGEWLRGNGEASDIVISSRIRLARNLADFPFVGKASESDRQQICEILRHAYAEVLGTQRSESDEEVESLTLDIDSLEEVDREFLVERHLISRELATVDGPRLVMIDGQERFSLMTNEEDHLRIQVMHAGLNLDATWELVNGLDDQIEKHVTYAFHEELGYLTACPTNIGTGLRVSVMLHLPALAWTRQIEKVFRSMQKINLAVRGLYGEGSQALGDFFQISNQITLGRSEEELINQVADIIPVVIDYERQAREFLLKENHEGLHDRVARAFGVLKTAQKIGSEETMELLSSVRMGINLGLIEGVTIEKLNRLFLRTQPAHLQKNLGSELDTTDRHIERARYLRDELTL